MNKQMDKVRLMVLTTLILSGVPVFAQTLTATGTINATLTNKNAIGLVFDSDPSGVVLGGAGTSAATLNYGNISAFGPLTSGVSRLSVTAANFTVRTVFDIQVIEGGLTSTGYTLRAQLASALPTGFGFKVDGVTLVTTASTIQTNGTYNTNVRHDLDLTVATAAPGAGGPTVGVPLSTVLSFQATAN